MAGGGGVGGPYVRDGRREALAGEEPHDEGLLHLRRLWACAGNDSLSMIMRAVLADRAGVASDGH